WYKQTPVPNLNVLGIGGPKPLNVVFPQQVLDEAFWQGAPAHSVIIPILSAQKISRAGGQAVQKLWMPYSDDPGVWLAAPLASKAFALTGVSQSKFYGQAGQSPPYRWKWTEDDSAPWAPPLAMLSSSNVGSSLQGLSAMPPSILWAPDDPDE